MSLNAVHIRLIRPRKANAQIGSDFRLVAITPAAGYVGTPAGALIGLVASAVSNLATRLKVSMRVDDPLDIFAVHGISGVVGLLMTGLFAQASVAANDGYLVIPGGWLDHNYIQLAKQLAWVVYVAAWAFVTTYLEMFREFPSTKQSTSQSLTPIHSSLLLVIDKIPGCHFRSTQEAEIVGIDETDHGEWLADYAWHQRDLESLVEREQQRSLSTKCMTADSLLLLSLSQRTPMSSQPKRVLASVRLRKFAQQSAAKLHDHRRPSRRLRMKRWKREVEANVEVRACTRSIRWSVPSLDDPGPYEEVNSMIVWDVAEDRVVWMNWKGTSPGLPRQAKRINQDVFLSYQHAMPCKIHFCIFT